MEVALGAYNSSAGLVKNGLASSCEKLCECSRLPRRSRGIENEGCPRNIAEGPRSYDRGLRWLDLAGLCTLHAVRIQTDLRGFARQKVTGRGPGIYIGNAYASETEGSGSNAGRTGKMVAAYEAGLMLKH